MKSQLTPLPPQITDTTKSSDAIPPTLKPFINFVIGGLVIIIALVSFAIVRQLFLAQNASNQNQTAPQSKLETQPENGNFSIAELEGVYTSLQGNVLQVFPNQETATNFSTCRETDPNATPGDCQLIMQAALEEYPLDYENSLKRLRDANEPNLPQIISFTDARGREWTKTEASLSQDNYTQTAEVETENNIFLLSIRVNISPYQAVFSDTLTPESLNSFINNILSTVDFTNQ